MLLYKVLLGATLIYEQAPGNYCMALEEPTIYTLLASKNEAAFEQVFKNYYKNLHAYACTFLKDEADSDEVVQQVFYKLWERSGNGNVSGSTAAYLYRAVHNECLNHLKHRNVKDRHELYVAHSMKQQNGNTGGNIMTKELEHRYLSALKELPEQCRTVFQLSRFEDMKYREIADTLNISVKTVENQMGKALKFLRLKLAEFLLALFTFLNL